MTGKSWISSIIVFILTGVVAYFAVRHFINKDLALTVSATAALLSIFVTSKLSRLVLEESIRYPKSSSQIANPDFGLSSDGKRGRAKSRSDWEVKARK